MNTTSHNLLRAVVLAAAAFAAGAAFAAAAGEGRVSGRIVDEATGRPTPGCRVMLFHTTRRRGYYASTDKNGRYEIAGLPWGRYRVRVRCEGYAEANTQRGRWAAEVTLSEQKPAAVLNLALRRGGSIAGVLKGLDEETAQYYAVFAFPVDQEGRPESDYTRFYARVDVTGRYELNGLPSGRYLLMAAVPYWQDAPAEMDRLVSYYGDAFTPAQARLLTLNAPARLTGKDLRLRADGGALLQGRVADDESGLPAPRCLVHVFDRRFPIHHLQTMTEEDGSYAFHVMGPGAYQVVADARQDGFARLSKWVDFAKGDRAHAVHFRLQMGVSMSGAIVTDAGEPLRRAYRVYAYVSPDPSKVGRRSNRRVYGRDYTPIQEGFLSERIRFSRADGTFRADALPPGRLTFHLSNLPSGYSLVRITHPDFDFTNGTPPLRPGQDLGGVRFIVSNRTGAISGRVVFVIRRGGKLIETPRRARVRTYFWNTRRVSSRQTVFTGRDGSFVLRRVPIGRHKLEVVVGARYAYRDPGPVVVKPNQTASVGVIRVVRKP